MDLREAVGSLDLSFTSVPAIAIYGAAVGTWLAVWIKPAARLTPAASFVRWLGFALVGFAAVQLVFPVWGFRAHPNGRQITDSIHRRFLFTTSLPETRDSLILVDLWISPVGVTATLGAALLFVSSRRRAAPADGGAASL